MLKYRSIPERTNQTLALDRAFCFFFFFGAAAIGSLTHLEGENEVSSIHFVAIYDHTSRCHLTFTEKQLRINAGKDFSSFLKTVKSA